MADDDHDHDFGGGDAGASSTYPMQVGAKGQLGSQGSGAPLKHISSLFNIMLWPYWSLGNV